MLVCVGVASSLFFQMLVNTGMCIGITPVIGITLPFFSYGGSSLMSTFGAVGLVSGAKYRLPIIENLRQRIRPIEIAPQIVILKRIAFCDSFKDFHWIRF